MMGCTRKIGIKEMASKAGLKTIYELLREVEADICMIAHVEAQNGLWEKNGKYFRSIGENLAIAMSLLELMMGEFEA